MTKKLYAFIAGFGAGFIGGLISTVTLCLLNKHILEDEIGPPIIIIIGVGIFTNGIILTLLSMFLYLPICLLDKEHVNRSSFKELLTRYCPIVTIPSGIIFFSIYSSAMNNDDKWAILIIVMHIFLVSCCSLWFFTKTLQSYNS